MKKRRVVITGAGLVSALGDSLEAFWRALAAGERGFSALELFPANGLSHLPVGEVKGFDPARYLGDRNFRPLDRNSRLAATAAHLALVSAGLLEEERRDAPVGLVLGTMFGSVRTIAEFDRRGLTAGPNYVKPFDFANSVINAPAGQTAIWHGLTGVNSTISGGATAGVSALAYATDLIRAGRATTLLAGGSEELCHEALLSAAAAGWLHRDSAGAPVPFARSRSGAWLGEGAALLVLEEEEHARRRGATVLAEVVGHGSAFDTSRARGVEAGADAITRAVSIALGDAGVSARQIGAVAASASGSLIADLAEARGLAAVLGAVDKPIGVSSVKAHLGETLGAAGGLQAITLLTSLIHGRSPGVPGHTHDDSDLPASLSATSAPINQPLGLVTALGGDGQVAAVLMRRAA